MKVKMELFDVTKYQLATESVIDWEIKMERLGILLSQYKSTREKLGLSSAPKIHETYSFLYREEVPKELPKELLGDPICQEFKVIDGIDEFFDGPNIGVTFCFLMTLYLK